MQQQSLLLVVLLVAAANSIQVKTPLGSLVGKVNNNESVSFLAVPYAKPPTGKLRFQGPSSPFVWNETRDATKNGAACIQPPSKLDILGKSKTVSEDCLTLDIFVDGKSINQSAKMPVLVFIHGGSFVSGSSALFDLSKFVAGRGVVAVAIQYRLGLLGFAQSPDDKIITGNNGLKDQVAALKWVRNYIGNFGGDGNQITVSGESAGSISIAYHLVSPITKKIMKHAILESGAHRTLPVVKADEVEKNMQQVIQLTDCRGERGDEKYECLKRVQVKQLVEIQQRLSRQAISFTPTIDTRYFANKDPVDSVEQGRFTTKLVSLIVGQNGNEGALFLAAYAPQIFPLTGPIRRKIWYNFELKAATPLLPKMARPTWRKIVDLTFNGRFAINETELANTMGKVLGDELFNCPNREFTKAYVETSPTTRVYYYDFLTRPKKAETKFILPYIRDAIHSDELQFVYGKPLLNETAYTRDEVDFSEKLITEWTSFVKTGSVADKKWPKVTLNEGQAAFSHIVFLNARRTQYKEGFPKNYCSQLKEASRSRL